MAPPQWLEDLLMPGGKLIGTAGSKPAIRVLLGGLPAAEQLLRKLTQGGTDITPPGYPGQLIQLTGGEIIGLRSSSTSGPPTIDVNVPPLLIDKIKFP